MLPRPLLLVALALVSCTHPPPEARPEPPRDASVAVAPPPAAPPAPAIAADAGPILSWTDPQAIAELTRSCSFDPSKVPNAPRRGSLSCAFTFEQSCVPDPCLEEAREKCQGACADTCRGCGDACVGQCESCKQGCKDDACARACAESCGRCRQECMTARDRCGTGHCEEVYDACRVKIVGEWLAKGCDAACAPMQRCQESCGDDAYSEACNEKCSKKVPLAKACNANANPMICDAMRSAPERKKLDPIWTKNHCDDVCAKVWACAKATCEKRSCVEPIKEYAGCAAKTPLAKVCGITMPMLCPEPYDE